MYLRRLTSTFAGLAFLLVIASGALAGTTKTIVVNSAASGGPLVAGTLTWAIYQANYQGADINYINFNLPPSAGEIEIVLTETLYLARPTIIDATTQPGYAGQPAIRINCNGLASGFYITAAGGGLPGGGGSTIRGFRISNYSSNAITIARGADSNLIADNQIGFVPLAAGKYLLNATTAPLCRGIGIQSNSNTIRGNTISGVSNGITLGEDIGAPTGALCKNNTLERNFVGTDPTGMSAIGNNSDGIFLGAGVQGTLIGPGNVLSGMASSGVEILHPTATDNRIFGNKIGLNAAGTGVIPNGELGVLIANGAMNNWVGGPYGGSYAGNYISGNPLGGVVIGQAAFPGGESNHVEGNFIGTDGSGSAALGTQTTGVTVESSGKNNVIRKNVIVGQANHGVVLANATGNMLYGNWLGVTDRGVSIPNGAFGVYVHDASNNIVQLPASSAGVGTEQNFFGTNGLGMVGVDGTSAANVIDLTSNPAVTPPPRLLNISTRMRVETGSNVLIGGFIITGTGQKKVLIRAIGPSLPVGGALADPVLQLFNGSTLITQNDNWGDSPQKQAIIDTLVPPSDAKESAIVATLNPGSYTAVVSGAASSMGVALVEVYDLDATPASRLVNISTRGKVELDTDVMIGGFIVGGSNSAKVLVRAIGPSLAANVPGTLTDPTLRIANAQGATLDANDNWKLNPQKQSIIDSGAPPSDDRESAVVDTLPPGSYTAVVSGVNATQGVALVEVFNLN